MIMISQIFLFGNDFQRYYNRDIMNSKSRDILKDRYIINDLIGKGSFAYVYKGYDKITKKIIAIKSLKTNVNYAMHSSICETDEFDIYNYLSSIKTDNSKYIIKCYDNFSENGITYTIMEYFDGITLDHFIKNTHNNIEYSYMHNSDSYANIMYKLAEGLHFIHSNNVVHRDIKPANVLINSQGGIKIIDFGLSETKSNYRVSSNPKGTPLHMSPQIIDHRLTYNDYIKADIWALGILYYKLINGKYPYIAQNFEEYTSVIKNKRILSNHKKSTSTKYSNSWFNSVINMTLEKHQKIRCNSSELLKCWTNMEIYIIPKYGVKSRSNLINILRYLGHNIKDNISQQELKYIISNNFKVYFKNLYIDISEYLTFYKFFYCNYVDLGYNDLSNVEIAIEILHDIKYNPYKIEQMLYNFIIREISNIDKFNCSEFINFFEALQQIDPSNILINIKTYSELVTLLNSNIQLLKFNTDQSKLKLQSLIKILQLKMYSLTTNSYNKICNSDPLLKEDLIMTNNKDEMLLSVSQFIDIGDITIKNRHISLIDSYKQNKNPLKKKKMFLEKIVLSNVAKKYPNLNLILKYC